MLLPLAVDGLADEDRAKPPERPCSARTIEHCAFRRDQLAILAALEDLFVRADDLDVGVARALPAPGFADLEVRIDPPIGHAQAVRGGATSIAR